MLKIQEYLEGRNEEDKELTFKPRLIAEEMLNKKGRGKDIDLKYQVNIHEHEARMERGRQLRQEDNFDEIDYVGSGTHWKNELTVPEPPDFNTTHQSNLFGLEKLKTITKPVVRNGEIV